MTLGGPEEHDNQAGRRPIRRALISVYDKTGLAELARGLHDAGVDIVSTGSTAKTIAGAGVPVTPVEEVTGFPEVLDGRVKTLHPQRACRPARRSAQTRTCFGAGRTRHRRVRTRGRQPVPIHRDRRLRRQHRRVRRADRHRRPVDGARRREEPSERGGGGGPVRLRRCAGRGAGGRVHSRGAEEAGVVGLSAHRRVRRGGGVVDGVGAGSRGSCISRCRHGWVRRGGAPPCCATGRTRISRPRCTATTPRGRAWLRPSSCTEKRCPTTTTPTPTPPGGPRSTTKRSAWRSSSTPTRAASLISSVSVADAHRKAHECDPLSRVRRRDRREHGSQRRDGRNRRRHLHRGHHRARL